MVSQSAPLVFCYRNPPNPITASQAVSYTMQSKPWWMLGRVGIADSTTFKPLTLPFPSRWLWPILTSASGVFLSFSSEKQPKFARKERKTNPKFRAYCVSDPGISLLKLWDVPASRCVKQQKKGPYVKFLSGTSQDRRVGPHPKNIQPKNSIFKPFSVLSTVTRGGWVICYASLPC